MATIPPAKASRASRLAYACGMALKRGYRRINMFESRLAERAVAVGVPVGKLLVRGGFLMLKLTVVGVLFFISFWLLVSVVTILIVLAVIQLAQGASDMSNINDLDHPMHRNDWPELYDEWGSLK